MNDYIHCDLNQMIVELNQTTERNIALIEERINALSSILTTADKRIAMLSERAERPMKHRPKRSAETDTSAGYLDLGKSAAQATTLRSTAAKKAEDSSAAKTPDPDRVVQLHEQGIEPTLIATRLGTTVGEVELIISLRAGNR